MYYLRRESHENTIPEIKKTDGTIIPERKYQVGDRALYKHNRLSRFYRDDYPKPHNKGVHLYTCKRLSTILKHREALHNYCGEYFDVYDENGKVDISKVNRDTIIKVGDKVKVVKNILGDEEAIGHTGIVTGISKKDNLPSETFYSVKFTDGYVKNEFYSYRYLEEELELI